MTGHSRRPGPRPDRTAHQATWAAAAAVILLALAACAATTAIVPGSAPKPAPLSFGSGGHRPTLTGAGSTFVAPSFARYQQHPAVGIGYAVVGSGAGIAAFSAQQADFGAADVPMTAAGQAAARGGPATQVPDALGGVGVAYNLNLPAGQRLHLTGPVLARIYLGQIVDRGELLR
jgi:phosphate transport system substrate-binding protein